MILLNLLADSENYYYGTSRNATDAVIDAFIPLLETDDIIIDGGNAKRTDSTERKKLNALDFIL